MLQFGDSVTLRDFIHRQTDDNDNFYSLWSTDVPPDTYSLSLQFIDNEGNGLHQLDNPLPRGAFAYRIDRVPRGTLPDDVAVTVNGIVYDWQTGVRLPLDTGGDVAALMTIDTE